MAVFNINGEESNDLHGAVEICRRIWSDHKAPLIAQQLEQGGPKVTDPAPKGTDEADESEIREGVSGS